jgi:hypothetical protein
LSLAVAVVALATPAAALADARDIDMGDAPIVRVVVGRGSVNVRTWDRPTVHIDDGSNLTIRQLDVRANEGQSAIPILAGNVDGPDGAVELPAESFAVSTIPPGLRSVVSIRGQDANVAITVPKDASLVTVQLNNGRVNVNGYRGGTFIARVRNGSVHLDGAGGDGFVQVMKGPVVSDNSSFDRLRVRTGTGNAVFNGTHAKQIEVSSVFGSILYDGGTFEPGLAHFETQNGDVAIGVNGPADLGGRSSTGHVYSNFEHGAQVSDNGSHAVVGGGGPLVSATSATGNVYLFDGSLRSRHSPPDWDGVKQAFARAGPPYRPAAAAAVPARVAPPPYQSPQALKPVPAAKPPPRQRPPQVAPPPAQPPMHPRRRHRRDREPEPPPP